MAAEQAARDATETAEATQRMAEEDMRTRSAMLADPIRARAAAAASAAIVAEGIAAVWRQVARLEPSGARVDEVQETEEGTMVEMSVMGTQPEAVIVEMNDSEVVICTSSDTDAEAQTVALPLPPALEESANVCEENIAEDVSHE